MVDLDHEKRLAAVMVRCSRRAVLSSAHDLSDGGLAQALVESSLRRGFGVHVVLPPETDPFVWLFSESAGRVLVSVRPGAELDLVHICADYDVPLVEIGAVGPVDNAELLVDGQFSLPLAEIRTAWAATLPAVLGHPVC